jgi:drug/metabolite transporter (DMT)-like permease
MIWAIYSILGGFGQAFGWALKKKALDNKGVNNLLGFISYITAGGLFFLLWGIQSDFVFPQITGRFVEASLAVVVLNVLALWTAYKALDKAALSKLLPFISLTALSIVPVEYLLRDVLPSALQIVGMAVVLVGAVISSAKERPDKAALSAAGYFAVTLICYSITSPYMSVMVNEVGNGLFSGAVSHLGIGLGFALILLHSRKMEFHAVRTLKTHGDWGITFFYMIASGAVIALLENGPVNLALEHANASEVFALKRTMPIFALVLGVLMFGEKVTPRHWAGTAFLVVGSALVILYR